MTINERIEALAELGTHLRLRDDELKAIMHKAYLHNKWFTVTNIAKSLDAISNAFLDKAKLKEWVAHYNFPEISHPKSIGIIMAGNIPLVGFHDFLCVFVSGHKARIKLSEKDKILLPHLLKILTKINPACANYFEEIERLKDFDGVIATGSNNSARYFETYFGQYPHIIRKNRNAVAIFDGHETPAQLKAFGDDVFRYFGLGCRNVSKIYIPKDFDFDPMLTALHEHNELVLHDKYKNNFDYNYTLVILNKTKYKANGCIILTEEETIASRIASMHFEYYTSEEALVEKIKSQREAIQCVIGNKSLEGLKDLKVFPFGKAQEPGLMDYADGVDVMDFLAGLPKDSRVS